MLQGTQGDPVVGLDMHIVGIPAPPSPVPIPTPVPMPFVGMIFDPAALAVGAAISVAAGGGPGLVMVNGLPVANTGTAVTNLLTSPHLPAPGVTFVPPSGPGNDAKLLFGSLGVTLGGSLGVRLGDIALSCSDPVRMPTSMVIALPKGAPVLNLRPPVPDARGMAIAAGMGAALRALGSVVRAGGELFRGMRRGTPRKGEWGKVAGALARAASHRAARRTRDWMARARCFVTGHPVDVSNGRVFTDHVDFELPGPLPLRFERVYSSSLSWRDGPLGYGWSHSLDQAVWREPGKVVWLREDGREIEFLVTQLGRGEQVYEPTNRLALRVQRGGQYTIETAEGLVHEFAPVRGGPEGRARLSSIRTRDGQHAIELSYDERGRLARALDSAGRHVRFVYDGRDKLREVWLPHPQDDDMVRAFQYEVDAQGDLARVVDELGHAWTFAYKRHLLVKETDRAGVAFFFQWDGFGPHARCVRTWGTWKGGAIHDEVIEYDAPNRKTLVEDSHGRPEVYQMDAVGMVVAEMDGQGRWTKYEYDPESGQEAAVIDPLGRAVRRRFDARGNCVAVAAPGAPEVAIGYSELDLPVEAKDTLGRAWRWRYDGSGALLSEQNALGEERRHGYKKGLLAWVRDERGARVEYAYDAAKNLVEVSGLGGVRERAAYDRRGRVLRVEDARGGATTYRYDGAGRMIGKRSPVGVIERYAYDPEGNLTAVESPTRRVGLRYCGFHWLGAVDEGGARVLFEYSKEGHLVGVENEAGENYALARDGRWDVEREIGFDGAEWLIIRDHARNVRKVLSPNKRPTTITRDEAGRVLRAEQLDRTFTAFTYGADGRIASAASEGAAVRFERDPLGRVLREACGEHTVTSQYEPGGLRALMESTLGARMVVLRDERGDFVELRVGRSWQWGVSGAKVTVTRDAGGLEVARVFSCGVRVLWERDRAGRPVKRKIERMGMRGEWKVMDARVYRWDGDEQIASIVDDRRGVRFYRHDARGRLVAAWNEAMEVEHRAMDAVGNVYRSEDRSDRRYGPGGRVIEADGAVFGHDANGSVTEKRLPSGEVWRYKWSERGLLQEVEGPDGRVVRFAYDAFGRRVKKMVVRVILGRTFRDRREEVEAETAYVWDGDVLLHEIAPGGEVTTWYHDPESFAPAAKEQGGRLWWVVTDQIGTPTELIEEKTGEVAWQARIDLWGKMAVEVERTGCPIRWPGQYEDEETGLYYNRWRYYDPGLGRYLGQDPIGIAGGIELYGYVSDPLLWFDSLGLSACKSRGYDRPQIETRSGAAVRDPVKRWNEFLGPHQTHIDPRDSSPDPDRIWSIDGKRSVRFGEHEMSSSPSKFHYHEETWHPDKVENVLQRIPQKPKK
jgi:RHS repeat-associated protein